MSGACSQDLGDRAVEVIAYWVDLPGRGVLGGERDDGGWTGGGAG
jgi:hypothetical protein